MELLKKISLLFFALSATAIFSQKIYRQELKLMGSRFDISVVASDSISGHKFIEIAIDEIIRIEKKISSWDANSETSTINRNAGVEPVKVSKELFDLLQRAMAISKLTDGAFDISYASMDKIWKFDGSMKVMPSKEKIKQSVAKVGFENVFLNTENQTVFLKLKGMKIGFGAIGKGYAADKAKKILIKKGVKSGIINASGDMNTWGVQPNGNSWKVGITNPLNKNKIFAWFPLHNNAVVTSGNYEKYVTFNAKRYTHIIDPRTGYPSQEIVSVSVFASSAELADALATSIFVMGVDVGLNLINQLKGVDCVIVAGDGTISSSKNIDINNK